MSDIALPGSIEPALHKGPDLDKGFHPLTGVIYLGVVAAALLFVAYSIYVDVDATGARITTYLPYILLFIALLIALGFEFVNGFHDTANAVATVIYTRSLTGVVLSSGIAGTMAANGSGLQWSTVRNIAMAWVLTLPIAMMLSGFLYYCFASIF
jgi:inorganic phosphate transporter, PiT family